MECNKDAAVDCRATAEARFAAEDFKGARSFLEKAERLYPGLEGLQQLQAIINVHEMAKVKFGEQSDWYGVLQVEQAADEVTIKKQYKKLALGVHPDKNKFPGAEAAFKILSEAHAVLSDRSRRCQHDALRARQNGAPGVYMSRAPFSTAAPPPPNQQMAEVTGAFWTRCPGCTMQYQYYRRYLHYTVTCSKCQTSYVATEYPTQVHRFFTKQQAKAQPPKVRQVKKRVARRNVKEEEQPKVDEMLRGVGQARAGKSEPQEVGGEGSAKKEVMQEELKQQNGVAGGTQKVEGQEEVAAEAQTVDKQEEATGETQNVVNQEGTPAAADATPAATSASEKQAGFGAAATSASEQANGKRTRSRKRSRKQFVDDDDDDYVQGQLNVEPVIEQQKRPSSQPRRSSRKREQASYTFMHYDKLDEDDDLVQFPESKKSRSQQSHATEDSNAAAAVDSKPSTGDPSAVSLEDNVFHDFDKDRRSAIAKRQIWAAFDDLDGMPRWYCRIFRVAGTEAKVNWFESVPKTEHCPGCGEFKQQKVRNSVNLDALSHEVETASDTDNAALVYPIPGQVWCLYENFDSSWLEKRDEERKVEYSVVEVVRDEFGQGWNVVPLSRLDGFKTVFRRLDDTECKYVQSSELYKFSHLVPAVKLQGNERPVKLQGNDHPDTPAGCWELDTAALPAQLMQ